MDPSAINDGACPVCGNPGAVGQPCQHNPGCIKGAHRFIPVAEYEQAEGHDTWTGVQVGAWLVLRKLGAGGMATVYLAQQGRMSRLRGALKVLQPGQGSAERFRGEAEALASLNHPNIVRLLDYGVHGETPYLVMEYVEGGRTLSRLLKRGISREQAQDVLHQILNALEAAHAGDVVHRDIKPDNIMLQSVAGNPNLVRVVDFGVVKFTEHGDHTHMLAGTPVYMAPELFRRQHIGPWSDFYAVGALAWRMLTGERLYKGCNAGEIQLRKTDPHDDPTARLRQLGLPPAVTGFFSQALAWNPAERLHEAAMFRAAMDAMFAALPGWPISLAAVTQISRNMDATVGVSVASRPSAPPSVPPSMVSQHEMTPPPIIRSGSTKALDASEHTTGSEMRGAVEPSTPLQPVPAPLAVQPETPARAKALFAVVALLLLGAGGAAAWWVQQRSPEPAPALGEPTVVATAAPSSEPEPKPTVAPEPDAAMVAAVEPDAAPPVAATPYQRTVAAVESDDAEAAVAAFAEALKLDPTVKERALKDEILVNYAPLKPLLQPAPEPAPPKVAKKKRRRSKSKRKLRPKPHRAEDAPPPAKKKKGRTLGAF